MKRILNNIVLAAMSGVLGAFVCAEAWGTFTYASMIAVGIGVIMCNMPIYKKTKTDEPKVTSNENGN